MRAILTYHSIDDSGSPISIAPADFRRHLDWLAAGRVRVLGLADLAAGSAAGDGGDAVSLTFDDALSSFTEIGWPELQRRGLPATLFVPTGHVGGRNDWALGPVAAVPNLELLDWPALARMAGEGLALGSHGRRHLDLRRLDDSALEDELAGSARDLERETGVDPVALAYPYGGVDARVAAAAARRYRLACTTELKTLCGEDPPHRLPRLDAFYLRRPGALEAWGSRRFAGRLALRRAARRARAAVSGWRAPAPANDRPRPGAIGDGRVRR